LSRLKKPGKRKHVRFRFTLQRSSQRTTVRQFYNNTEKKMPPTTVCEPEPSGRESRSHREKGKKSRVSSSRGKNVRSQPKCPEVLEKGPIVRGSYVIVSPLADRVTQCKRGEKKPCTSQNGSWKKQVAGRLDPWDCSAISRNQGVSPRKGIPDSMRSAMPLVGTNTLAVFRQHWMHRASPDTRIHVPGSLSGKKKRDNHIGRGGLPN